MQKVSRTQPCSSLVVALALLVSTPAEIGRLFRSLLEGIRQVIEILLVVTMYFCRH